MNSTDLIYPKENIKESLKDFKYKKGDLVYISKGIKSEIEDIVELNTGWSTSEICYVIAGIPRSKQSIEKLNA